MIYLENEWMDKVKEPVGESRTVLDADRWLVSSAFVGELRVRCAMRLARRRMGDGSRFLDFLAVVCSIGRLSVDGDDFGNESDFFRRSSSAGGCAISFTTCLEFSRDFERKRRSTVGEFSFERSTFISERDFFNVTLEWISLGLVVDSLVRLTVDDLRKRDVEWRWRPLFCSG